jgi:hypothetical protein
MSAGSEFHEAPVLQYSSTPTLRLAGVEHEHEDEHEHEVQSNA